MQTGLKSSETCTKEKGSLKRYLENFGISSHQSEKWAQYSRQRKNSLKNDLYLSHGGFCVNRYGGITAASPRKAAT